MTGKDMALCVESALSMAGREGGYQYDSETSRRGAPRIGHADTLKVLKEWITRGQQESGLYFKANPIYSWMQTAGAAMPREDRRIVFDYAETYKAIFALCVKKEMRRPFAGAITAITFKANDDKSVVVGFADELQGTAATSEYSQDFLAAALVLYCRTCAIPVPKRGRKSVDLGADSVTLHIIL